MNTQTRPRRSRQLRSKRLRAAVRLVDRGGIEALPPYVGTPATVITQLALDRTPSKTDLKTAEANLPEGLSSLWMHEFTLDCEKALADARKRASQTPTYRVIHSKDSKGRYQALSIPVPPRLDYPHRLRLLTCEHRAKACTALAAFEPSPCTELMARVAELPK